MSGPSCENLFEENVVQSYWCRITRVGIGESAGRFGVAGRTITEMTNFSPAGTNKEQDW